MSMFVLAVALNGSALPVDVADRLQALFRGFERPVQAAKSPDMAVAWADLGYWPSPSVVVQGERIAVVGGDPVHCPEGRSIGRAASVQALAHALWEGDHEVLEQCHGTFHGLGVEMGARRLAVAVDKLGVRPVYAGSANGVLFLASSLWLLERLQDLPKRCDWRGLTEMAAFGYPLADRTSYQDIVSLMPGSMLEWTQGQFKTRCYWNWRSRAQSGEAAGGDPVEQVEAAFHRAVDDRLADAQQGLAFLSGGMDSRFIAARLRQQGIRLHTLNFAPEGSADLAYGRAAAQALGTQHFEFGAGEGSFSVRKIEAINAWRSERLAAGDQALADTRVLWSGDGGSVVLGHVYLSDAIVSAARGLGAQQAAAVIQAENRYRVSPHLFTGGFRNLADLPLQGIVEDLDESAKAGVEPGRAAHLFFLLNDQRRHLVGFFEELHLAGHDLHLPFFDARFMEAVLNLPTDLFLYHRLYNRLFSRLPFGLGQVPWQVYPGHEACPVAELPTLRNQWLDGWFDREVVLRYRTDCATELLAALRAEYFPAKVLSRPKLLVASWLTRYGLKDYSYFASAASKFLGAARTAGDG